MAEALARRPRIIEAEKSGKLLAQKLGTSTRELTVADAAARSGLALRDVERGLQWAVSQFGGRVKVTDKGALVYAFPNGLTLSAAETLRETMARVGAMALRGLKVTMKVWIMVSIIAYAVVFAAIAVALAVASSRGRDDRDDDRPSFGGYLAFRVLADLVGDAAWAATHRADHRRLEDRALGRTAATPKRRLYDRVFQFIFGPERVDTDPAQLERELVALVRARNGRIGVADVMAATGLDVDGAERRITRLLVDYEGEIEITDEGAVFYVFKELQRTTGGNTVQNVTMSWERPVTVPPLTGDNGGGTNALIGLINAFNLSMSGFAVAAGLTVQNLLTLLNHPGAPLADGSAPLLLGWIPLVMSTIIFAFPVARSFARARDVAAAAWENGKRTVLRLVTRDPHTWHPPERLARAFQDGAGREPSERELRDLLLRLGGDLKEGQDERLRWRFPDLAREAKALAAAREGADASEKLAGKVVYDSGE